MSAPSAPRGAGSSDRTSPSPVAADHDGPDGATTTDTEQAGNPEQSTDTEQAGNPEQSTDTEQAGNPEQSTDTDADQTPDTDQTAQADQPTDTDPDQTSDTDPPATVQTAAATQAGASPVANGQAQPEGADVAGAIDHGHTTNFGITNEKMGMWTFIGSECLFFGAMIATYLLYLNRTNEGPTALDIYDIPFTSASTFILLMSSLGMVLALESLQRTDMRAFRTWTLTTALLGMIFLSGQIYEFTIFVEEGFKLETSPFSAAFYMLTGFHGIHVTFGVIMLLVLWALSLRGGITSDRSETVEMVGLYWHFVDIVWIVIFTVIYLIPVG